MDASVPPASRMLLPRHRELDAHSLRGGGILANYVEAMNRAIALHQLKPIIDRIFPLAEAREAYHYLKSGTHFGKVVIQL